MSRISTIIIDIIDKTDKTVEEISEQDLINEINNQRFNAFTEKS